MKTYTVRDETGQERIIEEPQMYIQFKRLMNPVLTEIGMTPESIAAYDGDIYRLIGVIIAHVRQQHSSLVVARKEFKKLRTQRDEDFKTILRFMRMFGHDAESADVVELKERQAA